MNFNCIVCRGAKFCCDFCSVYIFEFTCLLYIFILYFLLVFYFYFGCYYLFFLFFCDFFYLFFFFLFLNFCFIYLIFYYHHFLLLPCLPGIYLVIFGWSISFCSLFFIFLNSSCFYSMFFSQLAYNVMILSNILFSGNSKNFCLIIELFLATWIPNYSILCLIFLIIIWKPLSSKISFTL